MRLPASHSVSLACWQTVGRAKAKNRSWEGGGHTINELNGSALSNSKPPPGVGGGRPNRPGAGVGIGILAERCHTAAEHFKAPSGSGRGQADRPGAGVGIGILAERCHRVFKPPPGVGGGRPNRPGAGVGLGSSVTHVCKMKAAATRPLFCEVRAKKGAAVRTLSAAERLSSYDKIATYPSDLWGRSAGVGAPARSSP